MLRFVQAVQILSLSLLSLSADGANAPPVIALPALDTVVVGTRLAMPAAVVDDSLPADSIRTIWRQIAPDTPRVSIGDSSYLRISIAYPVLGRFTFQLSASDGIATAYDTITIVVREPVPFVILSPAENERVSAGTLCTVTWQREPTFACRVFVSLDSGLTFQEITTQGVGVGVVTPSLTWHVPDSLRGEIGAIVRVQQYIDPNNFTLTQITLIGPSDVARPGTARVSPSGVAQPRLQKGLFDVIGRLPQKRNGHGAGMRLCTGTVVVSARVHNAADPER